MFVTAWERNTQTLQCYTNICIGRWGSQVHRLNIYSDQLHNIYFVILCLLFICQVGSIMSSPILF